MGSNTILKVVINYFYLNEEVCESTPSDNIIKLIPSWWNHRRLTKFHRNYSILSNGPVQIGNVMINKQRV